jgi:DNA-binding response OmpR family regulator
LTGAILIAGGNRSRAKQIAAACAARGFATSFAPHGAAALEAALSDVPDVVVAPIDLALIEGPKLAEILRANPRTQGTRFVFLGKPEDVSPDTGYFDEVLPSSAGADDVGMRVEAILAQHARINAMEREAESDHEVEGKLSQIPLTDLLQLFHMNRRSGTIELTRRETGRPEELGSLYLREGNLVQATVDAVEGEKALFRLLAWREGSFAFTPNRPRVAARILAPTRALLMEGMRQLDEWERVRASLPPLDARVVLNVDTGKLPNVVHPLTQEVLLLLEIYDLVRDVVDNCSHPDYHVLRTLQTLVDRKIVELRRDPSQSPAASGDALFSPAQVRRLHDWLQSGRSGGRSREAKLLLVSSGVSATRDFVRLLETLPGMQLSAHFRRGRFSPQDVEPVGQLHVDDGIAIQLLHVPADPSFSPVWPVAAHGALGTLFLLSGPVREAEEKIHQASDVVRRLPRARIFHLLLMQKGQRLTPEELQDKPSLLDDASLFLIQIEKGREAISLLRTMFARVMP